MSQPEAPSSTQCPLCFDAFPRSVLPQHAANCQGEKPVNKAAQAFRAAKDRGRSVSPSPAKGTSAAVNKADNTRWSFSRPKEEAAVARSSSENKRPRLDQKLQEACVRRPRLDQKPTTQEATASAAAGPDPAAAATPPEPPLTSFTSPLADQMRPKTLDDILGQQGVTQKGSLWRSLIDQKSLPSIILWGPPGCGKTSLAHVIARQCRQDAKTLSSSPRFVQLSACTAGVADVKKAIENAKNDYRLFKRPTLLFVDEVHRFNKLQQDTFLPHVEDGTITLIGATTENPSFCLNAALLSRCRVVVLEKLHTEAVYDILARAAYNCNVAVVKEEGDGEVVVVKAEPPDEDANNQGDGQQKQQKQRQQQQRRPRVEEAALRYLASMSDGDARTALNCFQIAFESSLPDASVIRLADIRDGLKRAHVLYDRQGDEHYHCASALQKSIRGSDDNAALYWTMRMLQGGEDPLFIARRLVRIASEDVGLADNGALPLAVAAMQTCQLIGKPECNTALAQCSVYLARANKSHEVYGAMNRVIGLIDGCKGALPGVPLQLRNASSKLGKQLGYGKGYSANLDTVQDLQYMPEGMENVRFFSPPK